MANMITTRLMNQTPCANEIIRERKKEEFESGSGDFAEEKIGCSCRLYLRNASVCLNCF